MSLTHAASGTHFNEPDFNDVVAREPEHVVRVELAWQPAFNVAKQRPYGQGGRGSDDGGGVAYRRYSLECVADEDAAQRNTWSGDFDMPWDWRAQRQSR